jgi:hypothetical protein
VEKLASIQWKWMGEAVVGVQIAVAPLELDVVEPELVDPELLEVEELPVLPLELPVLEVELLPPLEVPPLEVLPLEVLPLELPVLEVELLEVPWPPPPALDPVSPAHAAPSDVERTAAPRIRARRAAREAPAGNERMRDLLATRGGLVTRAPRASPRPARGPASWPCFEASSLAGGCARIVQLRSDRTPWTRSTSPPIWKRCPTSPRARRRWSI